MFNACFIAVVLLVAFCDALGTSECGQTPIAPDLSGGGDRIVGGSVAVPGSWPWHAGLHSTPFFGSVHFCGAALIDDQHVLTAAHCVETRLPFATNVHLGSHQRRAEDDSQVNVGVEHACMHKDVKKDIAVIKLKEKVKFSDAIRPACLPEGLVDVQDNETVYSTGWGITNGYNPQSKSDELKQVTLQIIGRNLCNREFRPRDSPVPDHVLCALRVDGSTCGSDSGGPLVHLSNGRWVLVGLVHGGPKICTSPDRALRFTSTAKLLPWLREYQEASNDEQKLTNLCDMAPNATRLGVSLGGDFW